VNPVLAGEILDCLSSDRRVFPYFRHRYALILVALAAGRDETVSLDAVRRSPLAGLLRKPILAAYARRDAIAVRELDAVRPAGCVHYVLTLALWGDPKARRKEYYQISRRGVNLVLQLNFSSYHDGVYRKLLRPEDDENEFHPFEWDHHPVNKRGRRTLAWARLDIDLDQGEALIEEVQSDWVRDALRIYDGLKRHRRRYGTCRDHWWFAGSGRRFDHVDRYVTEVLEAHRRHWDEAALGATVEFLVRDVGIRDIYYHTWQGGRALKNMQWEQPPVSLYEALPRQFCFERVRRAPRFLLGEPGSRYRRYVRRIAEHHGFWYLHYPRFQTASPSPSSRFTRMGRP
jgi:hypothetical protein